MGSQENERESVGRDATLTASNQTAAGTASDTQEQASCRAALEPGLTPARLAAFDGASPFDGTSPFDDAAIRKLNRLTAQFYTQEAGSFSATRQHPWKGWEQAWSILEQTAPPSPSPLTVLDLGCGNLRFERFLAERTGEPLEAYAVDACADLMQKTAGIPFATPVTVHGMTCDATEALLTGTLADVLPSTCCDMAVAFGFMHHLPRFDLRVQTLNHLLRSLKPRGLAVVSFWQFLSDERLAAKAEAATEVGRTHHALPPFGPFDRLLSWQDNSNVFRFCHHCTNEEIDALLAAATVPAREIARFSADGKHGILNRYLILQRESF